MQKLRKFHLTNFHGEYILIYYSRITSTYGHSNKLIMLKHCGWFNSNYILSLAESTSFHDRNACCTMSVNVLIYPSNTPTPRPLSSPFISVRCNSKFEWIFRRNRLTSHRFDPMRMQVSRRAEKKGHGRISPVVASICVRNVLIVWLLCSNCGCPT